MARFDLTDFEWSVIEPLLPTKVRGVKRVDDRRVGGLGSASHISDDDEASEPVDPSNLVDAGDNR